MRLIRAAWASSAPRSVLCVVLSAVGLSTCTTEESHGATGRTWVVATTGHNNAAGTMGAPLRTLNAALSRARSGDVIELRRGSYHESVTVTTPNLTIRRHASETVILDGSSAVTGFRRSGGLWVKRGWTYQFDHSPSFTPGGQDGTADGWRFLDPHYPMAAHPDGVWLDGRRLRQVRSAGQVRRGTFAVDDAGNRLILGNDPRGRSVRASTLARAIAVRASGVTLEGFEVRRYAVSLPLHGAVTLERPGIRVRSLRSVENAAAGLSAHDDNIVVEDTVLARNGLIGFKASGAYGLQLRRLNVVGNNVEHFNQAPVSGGIKVTRSRGVRILDSRVVDNRGTGIWCDESCYSVTVARNRVARNTGHGVFLELSELADVVGNLVVGNGQTGIQVVDTGQVAVWNNTVTGGRRSLWVVQDDRTFANAPSGHDERRPFPDPTVPWRAHDNVVHNNLLVRPVAATRCLLCVEDAPHSRGGAALVRSADGNLYGRPGSRPSWLVVWAKPADDPHVFRHLPGFTATTGQEARGRLVDFEPLTGGYALTTRAQALAGAVALPVPTRVAELLQTTAGRRVLGSRLGG